MATVVRLTEKQIRSLLEDAHEIEQEFKAIYVQLENAQVSEGILVNYRKLHNRYSTAIKFIHRQRELAGKT
ncbi:hypothetical protein JHL21_01445 [Devosia sp. WQ 349]|uniref:hypothetical protein n=1 Tax=Devosia sp. WQ 349K1 TaxID=2800329 RepID=UPI0019056FCF|nr:hypothetical protein [Devosia sp. WQ 349K1]MBK1793161.1 hypothetical protein [Devosia sp. WQ 349K1]